MCENCFYVHEGGYIEGPDHRVAKLNEIPSPYLTGLFDDLFRYGDLVPWIETTRGCPCSCTFCNDGHASRNRVNRRSQEFVTAEPEYIAERVDKKSILGLADLNFGMYKQDIETAGLIKDLITTHQWPLRVETSMGKLQGERITRVVDIINEEQAVTLKLRSSLQSIHLDLPV